MSELTEKLVKRIQNQVISTWGPRVTPTSIAGIIYLYNKAMQAAVPEPENFADETAHMKTAAPEVEPCPECDGLGGRPDDVCGACGGSGLAAVPDTIRDWLEDAPLENGNYDNTCSSCGEVFTGHKRRITCKLCHDKAAAAVPEPKITPGLLEALREQKQCDPDGNMCEVNRQAVDEAITIIEALQEQSDE